MTKKVHHSQSYKLTSCEIKCVINYVFKIIQSQVESKPIVKMDVN